MQIGSGGRLCVALACVLMLGGNAVAADSATTLDALRDIAGRVDAATREVLAAHAAHRAVAPHTSYATKNARGELDALTRAAAAQGFANDASYTRKQQQVTKLLANLERAEATPADAPLPALVATSEPEHTAHVALSAARGAACASALTIAPGGAIETTLASAGTAGSELWLRIAPAKNGYTRLDTAPTALDSEITLYGAHCPPSESEAGTHSDDGIGLAAAVAFDARGDAGARYARVRNLGRSGRVVARVETSAAILGRVTDQRNAEPLPARVQAVTPDGFYVDSVYADGSTGLYLLTVDPGSYYVLADDLYVQQYVPELYPDAPCQYAYNFQGCDVADATLLTLTDGQQMAGINIALNIGGRIAGTVRSAADGGPIFNAGVSVIDSLGNAVSNMYTDVAGRYTIGGLISGTYYVVAGATTLGYGAQVWNHMTCGGPYQTDCQPLDGTPLDVVRDTLTSGVDFDLPREAHIRASVSARDDAGVPLTYWTLLVYAADGALINEYASYSSTSLDTGPLPTGNYRAFVAAGSYFGQVWNGIDCASDCSAELLQGNLITLTSGAQSDVSFALLSMPTISGAVTEAGTNLPLANLPVALVPVGSIYPLADTYTDAAGHYRILPTQTGSYYVFIHDAMHRPTVYPTAPCGSENFSSCDLTNATPVTIAYGGQSVANADFALPIDGSISGRVAMHLPDGMTLPPLVPLYENIVVEDADGNYVAASTTTTDGTYVVAGIPGGTFYAVATGYGFNQAYPGFDCPSYYEPGDGDPIVVAQGQQVAGIDFDPMPSDYLFGRVTDQGGAPVTAAAIDLWSASDDSHCGVAVTNADGYYALQNTSYTCNGPDRLSTDTDSLYEDRVYDGILCPDGPAYLGLCSLDGGTDVSFPATPVFVIANFGLGARHDPVFSSSFDP